jgi:diguanylate cyclase (GGDEF)-like protein
VPLLTLSQTQQLAKQEFARARRYDYPLTLGLCRIDRIDSLADLYGQESRAQLLLQLARLFQSRARGTDLLGRFGEDRLLWVQPHTGLDGSIHAAERIRQAVEELDVQTTGKTIRVTLSVGLACFVDRNTLFFDTVLFQAEKALERAQARGGNMVEAHPLPANEGPSDDATEQ